MKVGPFEIEQCETGRVRVWRGEHLHRDYIGDDLTLTLIGEIERLTRESGTSNVQNNPENETP